MRKLLVVTSKPLDRSTVDALRKSNWKLHSVASGSEAQPLIAQHDFLVGLVVLWPDDPEHQAADTAELIRRERHILWLVAIERTEVDKESCLGLIAEYVHDFLSLPLDERRLAVILGHAYGMAEVGNRFLANQKTRGSGRYGLIGDSPPMLALCREIERAAACEVPVVLVGETGTGKEVAARAIHENSSCADGPFVPVNCASIPASLIQAELYGYEKGAFTGALDTHHGYIESADGGSLFLDEVAELPPEAQASLLRFLENGQVIRVGSSEARQLDVRVISATHADLQTLVSEQRFRLDLFYRLQVLTIQVPSLRARGEDVKALAQHFLAEFIRDNECKAIGFSRAGLAVIEQYDWPGNLRELRNRVHQAALYSPGPYISPADLRLERRGSGRDSVTLQAAREAAEKEAIRSALKRTGQNMTRAAEELQISRMTLYRLLQKHQLEQARAREAAAVGSGNGNGSRLGSS